MADSLIAISPAIGALHNQYLTALVLLLAGIIFTRVGSRILLFALRESGIGDALRRVRRNTVRWEHLLTSAAALTGYSYTLGVVLRFLELLTPALLVFAIALVVIVLTLAVLTVLTIIPNILAGRRLFRSRMLLLGKQLELPGLRGKLTRFTLTEIHLRTTRGELLRIPHRYLQQVLRSP